MFAALLTTLDVENGTQVQLKGVNSKHALEIVFQKGPSLDSMGSTGAARPQQPQYNSALCRTKEGESER
mgnify:CR=1 FL=1